MAYMTAKDSAQALLATVEAVEKVVAAIAVGRLPVPELERARKSSLRYAPHFTVGRGSNECGSIPYNAKSLEKLIIANGGRSKWIRVALLILENKEIGTVDKYTLDAIERCRPGYNLTSLAIGLKKKKLEWECLHGAELALGVEPR